MGASNTYNCRESAIELGSVGGWRYLIQRPSNGFPFIVMRRDLLYDQVEEELGITESREKAEGIGRAAMQRWRVMLRRLDISDQ